MKPSPISGALLRTICGFFIFREISGLCTPMDKDPYSTGQFVQCCGGLYKQLRDWYGTGRHHYRCRAPLTPPSNVAGGPGACTPRDSDPFSSGGLVECCEGLFKDLGAWSSGHHHHYLCHAPETTPVPVAGGTTIKVLEWNVLFKNHNTRLMASAIQKTNPDIVGLCEFTASLEAMAADLTAVSPGRDYRPQPGRQAWKGYGTDIIYDSRKWIALEGGVETVQCPGTGGGQRAANWVVLRERETSRLLITGGLHASYCGFVKGSPCSKVQECELQRFFSVVQTMKSKYQDPPLLWLGDLNNARLSRTMKYMFSVFDDLSGSHAITETHGGEIDYILGQQHAFRRLAGGRTGQGIAGQHFAGSDHFPIFATVAWDPNPGVGGLYSTDSMRLPQVQVSTVPWWLLAIPLFGLLCSGVAFALLRMSRPRSKPSMMLLSTEEDSGTEPDTALH